MSWLMIFIRNPRVMLLVALIAAGVSAGVYIRGLAASVSAAEQKVTELTVQKNAAIEAAAEAVRRANAAAASERRAAAKLAERVDVIAGAKGACLDEALPADLWEVE